tara:strand:+ start:1396 stop:2406 length:1011 start_codon:yes stop_codon:yes gene_type:complete
MSDTDVIENPTGDQPAAADTPPVKSAVTPDPDPKGAAPASPPEADPKGGEPPKGAAPDPKGGSPFYSSLPEDWRAQTAKAVAGEDASDEDVAKLQKQMERYGTYEDWARSTFDAKKKLGEKLTSAKLPDDASEEQVAEWRKANGVPEAADKYELNLGEGVVLQGDDKAVLDSLLPVAHDLNINNETMSQLGKRFFEARAQQVQARQEQDGLDSQEAQKQLRDVWKGDFAVNTNIFKAAISEMPEGLRETIVNARLPGGKGLMNDPNFVNFMVAKQRQANPTAALVPSGDGNPAETIREEIKKLEGRMGTPEWFKDDAAQKRLRDLYEAQERLEQQN